MKKITILFLFQTIFSFAQDFKPPANLHLPFSGSNSSISTSKQVQTSEDHSTQASLSPTSFNPNNVKMSSVHDKNR